VPGVPDGFVDRLTGALPDLQHRQTQARPQGGVADFRVNAMSWTRTFWPCIAALLAAALLGTAGCSAPRASDPKTFAVKGKVVRKDGRPFPGGAITFRSVKNPALTANGTISAQDGTFALHTLMVEGRRNEKLLGAPAGEYTVLIIPAMGKDQTANPPISIEKRYTVQAEDGNEFTITVEPRKGRP
jgi:hypothetical protein